MVEEEIFYWSTFGKLRSGYWCNWCKLFSPVVLSVLAKTIYKVGPAVLEIGDNRNRSLENTTLT